MTETITRSFGPCTTCLAKDRPPVPALGLPLKAPETACVVCTDTMAPLAGRAFVCQKCMYMGLRLWPKETPTPARLRVLRGILQDLGGSRARRLMLARPPWRMPAARRALALPPQPR